MGNAVAPPRTHDGPPVDEALLAMPNAIGAWRAPMDVRLYYGAIRLLERLQTLIAATLTGVSLGALSERRRHAIDRVYYDRARMYHTARYNEQGLFDWERQALEKYFGGCQTLLIASPGGGREVIALRRAGKAAAAFECHPELAAYANTLLERLGMEPDIRVAARDECPQFAALFTGAIVGWGAYMHIRSRQRRVAFLRSLRAQIQPGAPVLLSFFTRQVTARRFTAAARIAEATRYVLGGERVELGDYLVPTFVHCFTRSEVERELADAGFELTFFSPTPYGHAVGYAR
jgi:hypothetical protein